MKSDWRFIEDRYEDCELEAKRIFELSYREGEFEACYLCNLCEMSKGEDNETDWGKEKLKEKVVEVEFF